MLARLQTIALIAVVTGLIWLWAEAESLSTQTLTPRIEFVAPDENLLVRVLDAASAGPGADNAFSGTVRVRLQGATTAMDRAQRYLVTTLKLVPGVGMVPSVPGEYAVDLRDAIRQQPDIRQLGVTVLETEPSTVCVIIDSVVTLTLPVKPVVTGVELDGEPSLEAGTAIVRLPKSAADRLKDVKSLSVLATPEPDALARLRDDAPQTVQARFTLPEAITSAVKEAAGSAALATVSPQRAPMVLRLKSKSEAITIKSMPVWISMPYTEGARWDIEILDPFIQDVTITGPRDQVRALLETDGRLKATVSLSSDDLEKRISSKQVIFAFLPTPLSFSAAQTTVRLKISERISTVK